MNQFRALAVPVLVILTACNGGAGKTAPGPTLPPGGAFRDGLVYAAIKARLAGLDIDSTTRISVAIHAGNVILSGTVKDGQTKVRDVRLVRDIRGVNTVTDRLRISRAGKTLMQGVRDIELVAAVAGALAAQAGVNVAALRIDAANGTVTLHGHAASAALKSTMLSAAKKTPGVRNVVDRIAVK